MCWWCGCVHGVWGAPVEGSVGAFVVIDAGECVELVVQAGDGWGWWLGGEPFFERVVVTFDFSLCGGMAEEPVFLNDAQVVKELFKRVGLAVLGACSARVARAVDHGVVGQCGARVPVGARRGGKGFHHDGAGDARVCACVQEEP